MKKALLAAMLLAGIALLPQEAFSQAGGSCSSGNCKATQFTAAKGTGASVTLSGDAGVKFGDGTVQNTASTGFSGSATSYTATAAANAFAFKANQGALFCFDPLCKDYMSSDGGVAGQSLLSGISLRTRVVDTSGNDGVVFDIYSPSDSTVSNANLFEVRNNSSAKFTIGAGGTGTISGVTLTGGAVLAGSLQSSGNSSMEVRGGPFSGSSAIAVKLTSAQNLNTSGDSIACFYHVAGGTADACIDKDGTYSGLGLSLSGATPAAFTATGNNLMTSATADGASAVAFRFNATGTMANAGARVFSFDNGGTRFLSMDGAGAVIAGATTGNTAYTQVEGTYHGLNYGTGGSYIHTDTTSHGVELASNAANSGTNVGVREIMSNTLSGTTLIHTWENPAATVKASIEDDGTINGFGFHCTSSTHCGSITLSSGTGTATVVSGCVPICTDVTSDNGFHCSVSSTTLTASSTVGTSDVVKYFCF